MPIKREIWLILISVFCCVLPAGAQPTTATSRPTGPERWEAAIAAFEQRDLTNPPPKDAVLFVGSSSIVGWKLKEFFPDLATINRGFGGSQLADSLHFFDRIVLPYRPRLIVVYAGENDIAQDRSPLDVARDFEQFAGRVRAELPDSRIIFIGLKPSPSRWKHIEQFRQTNALIWSFIKTQQRMMFIDVEKAMLDAGGHPREELFLKDKLHMTRAGYEIWSDLLRPHLQP
jgi:lysophospholipase L1-like esterase